MKPQVAVWHKLTNTPEVTGLVPQNRIKLAGNIPEDPLPFIRIDLIDLDKGKVYDYTFAFNESTIQVTVFSDGQNKVLEITDTVATGLYCRYIYQGKKYTMLPENMIFQYDSDRNMYMGIITVSVFSA